MKIAIISSIHTPIKADYPGGIEVFNYTISKQLKKMGHEVTLFASGDSKVDVKLVPISEKALFNMGLDTNQPMQMRRLVYYENNYYIRTLSEIKEGDFDIIHHSHSMVLPIYILNQKKIPSVLTMHLSSPDLALIKGLEQNLSLQANLNIISISHRQQEILPQITFFNNIYNGINLDDFEFNKKPQDYLAWMGRFVDNKGPQEAIDVTLESNKKLKMAGQPNIGSEQDLFNNLKTNYFTKNANIEYVGPVNKKQRLDLLQNAKAFLMPIKWEEPFGLVMIEAMACGTPVIAFNRGSVSEVVKDGKTGFICPPGDIEAISNAVKIINEMPEKEYLDMRQNCRKHVEENFTIEKMAEDYEKVYNKAIEDLKNKNR